MPKSPRRNKAKLPQSPKNRASGGGRPKKIDDLLAKSLLTKALPGIALPGGAAASALERSRQDWADFFARHLEPSQLAALGDVVERDGTLTLRVRSAEWAARLRYALPTIWPAVQEFRPQLLRCVVKVQPAAASTGART